MQHSLLKIAPAAALLILAVPFAASQTRGDIIETSGAQGPQRLYQQAGERIGTDAPLRVQCWQFGREIIDQSDLHGMSLKPLLEQESVSFKRKGTKGVAVHIVSVEDTVCMIQADR